MNFEDGLSFDTFWLTGFREGGIGDVCPLLAQFAQLILNLVFRKNWPNNRLAPPLLGSCHPHLRNPGSAINFVSKFPNTKLSDLWYSCQFTSYYLPLCALI